MDTSGLGWNSVLSEHELPKADLHTVVPVTARNRMGRISAGSRNHSQPKWVAGVIVEVRERSARCRAGRGGGGRGIMVLY